LPPRDDPLYDDIRITYDLTFKEGNYEFNTKITPLSLEDIGAYVGDTAIYLALRYPTVERVIITEPNLYLYKYLIDNITRNLRHVQVILDPAVVTRNVALGEVSMDFTDKPAIKRFNTSPSQPQIRALMLTKQRLLIPDNVLVKIDCEGCEYDLEIQMYAPKGTKSWVIVEWSNKEDLHIFKSPVKVLERKKFYNNDVVLYEVAPGE
jgi:FkbM family methyltransferase